MARRVRLIPEKMLSSDEKVVIETRPSAWLYMKSAALAILIALIAMILFLWIWIPNAPSIPYLSDALEGGNGDLVQLAFGVLFIVMLMFFLYKYLKWGSTVYAATDERIITKHGILSKTYEEMPLQMITNMGLRQSLGKRALGYGTIIFSTHGMAAGAKADMVWDGVPDHISVNKKIQEVLDIRAKPKV